MKKDRGITIGVIGAGKTVLTEHIKTVLNNTAPKTISIEGDNIDKLIEFTTKEAVHHLQMIKPIPVINLPNPKKNQNWKPKHKRGY